MRRTQIFLISLSAGVAAWFLSPQLAAADDPVVVDMSDGVPSRGLPFGDPFSITFSVKPESSKAFGFFFEYSHAFWGFGSGKDRCATIAEQVKLKNGKLGELRPGSHKLGALLELKSLQGNKKSDGDQDAAGVPLGDDLRDRPALALVPWARPATTDGTASNQNVATLKVPGGHFFQAGASYCFVGFEAFDVKTSVLPKVEATVAEVAACRDKQCISDSLARFDKLFPEEAEDERAKANVALGPVMTLANHREKLLKAIDDVRAHGGWMKQGALASATAAGNDVISWTAVKLPAKDAPVDFADALFVALVQEGTFGETDKNGKKSYTVGSDELVALRLTGQGKVRARLRKPTGELRDEPVDVDLNKVPALPDVSFGDLLVLATGQIPIGNGGKIDFDTLTSQVRSLGPESARAELDGLSVIAKQLANLKTQLDKYPEETERRGQLVLRWFKASDGGHATEDLNLLASQLGPLADALGKWTVTMAEVKKDLADTRVIAFTGANTGLTQNTWFANYVVPTVGYTLVRGTTTPTTGLQIYGWPNVTNQPMWTNGAEDLRRALSLQLAVALPGDPFGPDDRFSGMGNLPPILIGAGFNVIPWTTISAGAMLHDERRSTLSEESWHGHASFYVDFAVQTNVPDIIKLLVAPAKVEKE